MNVLAIDPGSERSAWVLFNGTQVLGYGIEENEACRSMLVESPEAFVATDLAIERIASYGMPVGREVFDTVFWCGRFCEAAWAHGWTRVHLVPRKDVKLHLCGQPRAKDANIRQALLDRFGGRQAALGTKKSPGPLYGVKADCWQALGLAVTFLETV